MVVVKTVDPDGNERLVTYERVEACEPNGMARQEWFVSAPDRRRVHRVDDQFFELEAGTPLAVVGVAS